MSNASASTYTPQDIAGLESVQVGNFINVALLAVVLYDFCITFGQEVEVIWCYGSKGKNAIAASILFLSTRYLAILYGAIGFIAGMIPLTTSCNAITRLTEALVLGLMLCFALFSAYRVYALNIWNNKVFSALVFLLNLVPFVINLYAFSRYTPSPIGPSFSPCAVIDPLSPALEIQFVRACRLTAIAADALVLFLTLAKTLPHWLEARRLKIVVPLSTALIQDGSVYFCILLLMNIFQMITFAVWETEFLTTFIFILTPVLSSRLLLNLRQVNAAAGAGATSLIINDLYTEDGSAPSTDGNMVTVVPAYETMSFGNLNLDAFDSITNSSPDLESNKKNIVSSHCLSPMHTVDIREASHDSLHTDSTLTPSSIFLGDARSSLELEVFQTRQIQATTSSC